MFDSGWLHQSAPDGYLLLDPELRIVAVSDAYLAASMMTREQIVGRVVFEVFPDNPDYPRAAEVAELRASLNRVRRDLRPDRMAVRKYHPRRPGDQRGQSEARYRSPTNSPVTGSDGRLAYIIHRAEDVTERRRERPSARAQRLESVSQLAGGVAHDFNNLLAAILQYASFVQETIAAEPANPRWAATLHDVEQIQRAAERATDLTRQLLTFGRRNIGQPQLLSLNNVVGDVVAPLHKALGESIELTTCLVPDLLPVLADPGQIEQVLVNVAVNARDAMPRGGTVSIDTANVVIDDDAAHDHGLEPGPYVRLRVSDTGDGMSQEIADKAFEPFFTTKPAGAGTGLSLSTVYGAIAQAGGQAELDSEPGVGTTFTALLPAADHRAAGSEQPASTSTRTAHTVLVVDDDDAIREVTRRILIRGGYHVLTAASGPEALELAQRDAQEIDLLLTDVIMPRMLGKEVADRIRVIRPNIRILYMSGYAYPVLTSRGTLDEGITLVEKPFTAPALLGKINEVLHTAG